MTHGARRGRRGRTRRCRAAGLRVVAVAVVGLGGGRRQGQPERAAGRRRVGLLDGEPARRRRPPGGGRGPRPAGRRPTSPRPGSASAAGCTSTAGRGHRGRRRPVLRRPGRPAVVPVAVDGGRRPRWRWCPGPADGSEARYADGRLTASGRWLVSVEERPRRPPDRPPVGGRAAARGGVRGRFPAGPAPGLGGRLRGRPPAVTRRAVAGLGDLGPPGHALGQLRAVGGRPSRSRTGPSSVVGAHRVAGGPGRSVGQPRWCARREPAVRRRPDRLVAAVPAGPRPPGRPEVSGAESLVDVQAEFHAPDWVLGQSTMAELADGSIVGRMHGDGRDALVRLRRPPDRRPALDRSRPVDQPCVSITGVAGGSGRLRRAGAAWCVLGSTPTEAQAVFEVGIGGDAPARRLSTAPSVDPDPDDGVRGASRSPRPRRPVRCPGCSSPPVGGPVDRGAEGPPPLVVFCHGGPTSAAEPGFDPVVQFFTSRGLAVAVVDYRGSSGYGRAYRRPLDGRWGEADIDDCVRLRRGPGGRGPGGRTTDGHPGHQRRGADRPRAPSSGPAGSPARPPGTASPTWSPWPPTPTTSSPATSTRWSGPGRRRPAPTGSGRPSTTPTRWSGPVLLLQGADDPVVPVDQAERFAAVLDEHHVPCRLTVFAGESHGFRRAGPSRPASTAELDFYRWLFGGQGGTDPPAGGVVTAR